MQVKKKLIESDPTNGMTRQELDDYYTAKALGEYAEFEKSLIKHGQRYYEEKDPEIREELYCKYLRKKFCEVYDLDVEQPIDESLLGEDDDYATAGHVCEMITGPYEGWEETKKRIRRGEELLRNEIHKKDKK